MHSLRISSPVTVLMLHCSAICFTRFYWLYLRLPLRFSPSLVLVYVLVHWTYKSIWIYMFEDCLIHLSRNLF
ncbi:hypothetical protein V1524DRAFT_154553 [Lipomyces starkeyi]